MQHINNVIVVMVNPSLPSKCTYIIDRAAEFQLIDALCSSYKNGQHHHHAVAPDISNWSDLEFKSFVSMTVKGLLNADLYTTLTEFMSRAEGSFGIQVKRKKKMLYIFSTLKTIFLININCIFGIGPLYN